jgi:hypothetical protein
MSHGDAVGSLSRKLQVHCLDGELPLMRWSSSQNGLGT